MAYLTKDKSNLIQLWNNKPSYDFSHGIFYAWKKGKEGIDNEVAIDVTNNERLSSLLQFNTPPVCIRFEAIDYTLMAII